MKACKLNVLMGASLKFGRGFGSRKAKLITDVYPNILKMKLNDDDMFDNIIEIHGFSEKLTNQFVDNFDEYKEFHDQLADIIDISHLTKKKKKNSKYDFKGEKIVFTGFRNKDWEEIITDSGGKVTTSVSKNTTMVVYVMPKNNKKPAKLKKAEDLEAVIYTKEEFQEQYKLV